MTYRDHQYGIETPSRILTAAEHPDAAASERQVDELVFDGGDRSIDNVPEMLHDTAAGSSGTGNDGSYL